MLARKSSIVFKNAPGAEQDTESSSKLSPDEADLVNDIINKSRQDAGVYLLRIKEHLRHTRLFLEFLRIVKDLKDKRIDPPSFIHIIATKLQQLHVSPELISGSITVLPRDCLLQVQSPNRRGTFIVTLRYPANTTVPVHVVCRQGTQATIGFFGHPGPTPNSHPGHDDDCGISSLKRKHSDNLKRDEVVVLNQEGLKPAPDGIQFRRSKRLRLQREGRSVHSSTLPLAPLRTPAREKLTVAGVVSLFTTMLSSRAKRRRLMEYREEKAQLVLDTMQALVDVPDILPSSKLKLKQALIKLSAESSLPPTCFSLHGLHINDFSPSEAPDGNFGEIYSGVFHEQPLCIKVVRLRHKSGMDKAVKAFLKEGVTWGQINHPNILPFYGIYRLQDKYNRLSLISPWLANGNVNTYLVNHPNANRHLLVHDISQGIAHLHKEGIVHGDLKGPNILVTKTGRACIADFGLANMSYDQRPNWTSLRSSADLGGTLRWQAPELLEDDGCEPTTNADVYAFGSIMYEVFTGQFPFNEISQQIRVMKMILDGIHPIKPSPTHSAWTQWGLTERIWELMVQCWGIDPDSRPLAKEIVKLVADLGPSGQLNDTRPIGSDEYLSPSAFRHAVHAKLNPLSEETVEKVVGWLREEDSSCR